MSEPEKFTEYYKEKNELVKKLHSPGRVGQAFTKLCDAGCEAKELVQLLFHLSHFPSGRACRSYTERDLRRMEKIGAKVKQAAVALEDFSDLLFYDSFGGLNFEKNYADWERPVQMPESLKHLAAGIHKSVASIREAYRTPPVPLALCSTPSIYQYIPRIVNYVRKTSGQPHHAALATLIGVAIQEPSFNEDQLKMICSRRK
jgi:hypothetical protein